MILRVISYRHLCSLLQSISVVFSEYVKEGGRSHRVHFVRRADFSDEDLESSDWYVGVHLPNCNIGEECEANWHGRSWKKEVVAFIVVYTWCFNVAPPTPVGAWSMALGLRQRFEYYLMLFKKCLCVLRL